MSLEERQVLASGLMSVSIVPEAMRRVTRIKVDVHQTQPCP